MLGARAGIGGWAAASPPPAWAPVSQTQALGGFTHPEGQAQHIAGHRGQGQRLGSSQCPGRPTSPAVFYPFIRSLCPFTWKVCL